MPVAENWLVVPRAIDVVAGDSAIETKAAGVTVRFVEALTPFAEAVIVAAPAATLTAIPVLSTVKTVGSPELQTTELLMSCALPSV